MSGQDSCVQQVVPVHNQVTASGKQNHVEQVVHGQHATAQGERKKRDAFKAEDYGEWPLGM